MCDARIQIRQRFGTHALNHRQNHARIVVVRVVGVDRKAADEHIVAIDKHRRTVPFGLAFGKSAVQNQRPGIIADNFAVRGNHAAERKFGHIPAAVLVHLLRAVAKPAGHARGAFRRSLYAANVLKRVVADPCLGYGHGVDRLLTHIAENGQECARNKYILTVSAAVVGVSAAVVGQLPRIEHMRVKFKCAVLVLPRHRVVILPGERAVRVFAEIAVHIDGIGVHARQKNLAVEAVNLKVPVIPLRVFHKDAVSVR